MVKERGIKAPPRGKIPPNQTAGAERACLLTGLGLEAALQGSMKGIGCLPQSWTLAETIYCYICSPFYS